MPENITRSLSDRIRCLAFPLIVLVVAIHCQVPASRLGDFEEQALAAPQALSRTVVTIARIAVPMFFAISGYLFFADCTGRPAQFGLKLRKRFWSLVVPFLIWLLLGTVAVRMAQSLGGFRGFEGPPSMNPGQTLAWWVMYPVPLQFWFVRELFVLTLLAPAIYIAIRWTGPALGLLALTSWVANYEVFPSFGHHEAMVLSTRSLAFFTLGGYLALRKSVLLERPFPPALPMLVGWVCSCALLAGLEACGRTIPLWIHNVVILVGIVAVWTSYPSFSRLWRTRWFTYLTGHTFFIFAVHEPYGQLVKRGLTMLLPRGPWAIPAVHLLTVVVVVCLCVIPSAILRKWCPRVYSLITGGRGRVVYVPVAIPSSPIATLGDTRA